MTERILRQIIDEEIILDFVDMTEPETYERQELIKKLNSATNRVIYRYFKGEK